MLTSHTVDFDGCRYQSGVVRGDIPPYHTGRGDIPPYLTDIPPYHRYPSWVIIVTIFRNALVL